MAEKDPEKTNSDVFEAPRQGPDQKTDPEVKSMNGSAEPAAGNMDGEEAPDDSDDSNAAPDHIVDELMADRSGPEEDRNGDEMLDDTDDTDGNLQLYTPSSLLDWGQFDVKFFSQLYTQTQFWDAEGNAMDQNNRTNYYSGIFNFVIGYNKTVNFGFDAWLQSVYIDDSIGSPFGLFTRPSGNNARTALTAIGPKVKWQPFKRVSDFTIQSSLLLPVAKDPEGRNNGLPFLATQNILWWTQVFYTYNFSTQFQLFAEVDLYWNIDRQLKFDQSGFVAMPTSAFFSYFPTSKATVYVNTQFWPVLGENVVSNWWWMAGVGGKYQLSKSFDVEVSYGRFLVGRGTAGPARTFNLGLRFVKW